MSIGPMPTCSVQGNGSTARRTSRNAVGTQLEGSRMAIGTQSVGNRDAATPRILETLIIN